MGVWLAQQPLPWACRNELEAAYRQWRATQEEVLPSIVASRRKRWRTGSRCRSRC